MGGGRHIAYCYAALISRTSLPGESFWLHAVWPGSLGKVASNHSNNFCSKLSPSHFVSEGRTGSREWRNLRDTLWLDRKELF